MRLLAAAGGATTRLRASLAFQSSLAFESGLAFQSSAAARAAKQNDILPSEGLTTDFDTALRACRALMLHAAHASHCSRKMNAAPKASPRKRHKFAARQSSCCSAGGSRPGIARMWRASDNFWKYAKIDRDSHKLQASACS